MKRYKHYGQRAENSVIHGYKFNCASTPGDDLQKRAATTFDLNYCDKRSPRLSCTCP